MCVKLSLMPSSIPHHYPAPVPVSNPVSKPEPVLETPSETEPISVSAQPQLEPKYPSPPNLESVNEPLLEPTIVPITQKPQSQPSVNFTPPVDLTPTSQVGSSGQMMVTAQEQSQSVSLFEPQHLGSSDLLLPPQSAAAMVLQESLPSCAQTVEFQQSVPVNQQASDAVHSGSVLPTEQQPTVDLQQPASDEMPPSSSSQPLTALGLSPDVLPQEAMTQHLVSETDLLNTSDCRPVLHVEEVSGCGDPNKSRAKEAATLKEVPCPCQQCPC